MVGRPGRIRVRRALALATCVLWLLGVELLPDLHLAAHDRDHTHGQAGEIISHGHSHGDAARAPSSPAHDVLAGVAGHAADGFAHRASAIHEPAPPMLEPLRLARSVVELTHAPIASPRDTHTTPTTARGPPAC